MEPLLFGIFLHHYRRVYLEFLSDSHQRVFTSTADSDYNSTVVVGLTTEEDRFLVPLDVFDVGYIGHYNRGLFNCN